MFRSRTRMKKIKRRIKNQDWGGASAYDANYLAGAGVGDIRMMTADFIRISNAVSF